HGNPRFTFGISDLRGGIPFVALLIGLYALSQAFLEVEQAASAGMAVKSGYKASPRPEDNRVSFGELRSCAGTIFKSGIMGTVMGALPGIGPAISSFVCYGEAKRTAKNPDEFGKGALRGVAAAEAGNSSVCGANLLPLLTLGIPGDMVAAVLLGAFLINGMQPGPLLFQEHAVTVYSIFMGMILINGFNFLFGRLFIRFFITVTNMSKAILYPIIVVLCVAGIYAYNSDMFDVKVMLVFGVVGYFLRKLGFPLAPMAIAFLLGPMTEEKARQSLILARGDLSQIFYHPIADLFLAVTVITLAWTIRKELKWRRERSISKARIPKEDS
ncbi:MAG: tripartite tricarboxylate transporter permease, partial [Nitrospinota bacterium]